MGRSYIFTADPSDELYPGGASHTVVKSLDRPRMILPGMDSDTLLSRIESN
jgi:hypothetical protein